MASSGLVNYPSPGCIVEFLEDNAIHIAMVLEDNAGKLRLLLPSRRETKLAAARILPWAGPRLSDVPGREEAIRILEQHRVLREELSKNINPLEVWELVQGEVEQADVAFFASLFENDPDIDKLAAFGHALLGCKTHFRLQAPKFQIYDAETVAKKKKKKEAREERENLMAEGSALVRQLWELAQKGKVLDKTDTPFLQSAAADRIRKILHARMLNPESMEDAALWQMVNKGLPDDPLLPIQLLIAWGEIPPHYNFWLERSGYEPGDDWWQAHTGEVDMLAAAVSDGSLADLPLVDLPLLSIDGSSTRDIDDAFHISKKDDGGWKALVALACPALVWPFGSPFDQHIRQRATSLYLPEAEYHMLPEKLGIGLYSLFAGKERPVFCVNLELAESGAIISCEPFLARARLAANLSYNDAESVMDGTAASDNAALPFAESLKMANEMANARESFRIAHGAIVMQRHDPRLSLHGSGQETIVELDLPEKTEKAQKIVSELMIAASTAIADWALERKIPLLHRTQDIALPREYAGIWSEPWEMSRIMRSLVPSLLEVRATPHAALGVDRYAPVTSPLRRYGDLLNEAQILEWLKNGQPLWSQEELENLLSTFAPALESAGHVQKFRPRYWKLLYFRQQGEQRLWPGVITEDNEINVTVALPEQGLHVRGRRNLFDDKIGPGTPVQLRLGRVHPLHNDIHILEVRAE